MESSEKKPTLLDICNKLIENNILVYYNDEIYYFNGKIYTSNNDFLRYQILDIDHNATPKKQNDVLTNLEMILKMEQAKNGETKVNDRYIAFNNGVYDLLLHSFFENEFSSSYFIINQLPIDYFDFSKMKNTDTNEAFTIPYVHSYFDSISSNNERRKQAILEMIGYSMTSKTDLQLAFVLYGQKAGNGKSTLIDIWRKIVGSDNVSDLSLKEMSNHRFGLVEVKGKLVNISSETSNEMIKDLETFKKLVTSDVVKGEKKFVQKRDTFRSMAKIVLVANELPIIPKDKGFYRRLHIIPLEHVFTKEEIHNFKDTLQFLTNNLELSYIAYISLKAYEEMVRSGADFSNIEESTEIRNLYEISNDNVMLFIKDTNELKDCFSNKYYVSEYCKSEIVTHDNKKQSAIKTDALFIIYKHYCTESNYISVGRNKFYMTIENKLQIVERIKIAGDYYFVLKSSP